MDPANIPAGHFGSLNLAIIRAPEPASVIRLIHGFSQGLRGVECLLAERGVTISYKSIRE